LPSVFLSAGNFLSRNYWLFSSKDKGMSNKSGSHVAIVGAGPAGITAAYELSKYGITGDIFESDNVVGGISRTEERDGFRFDIGGHRFFSRSNEVEELWTQMLPESMLVRPRLSRVYYGGKFYDYPLKATNALRNMGVLTALSCISSYALARLRPVKDPESLEEWVTNQFGSKLYSMFFKTYTEKVWGIPCGDIGADWAAQRIKGLSLGEAVRNAILGQKKGKIVKTLIDQSDTRGSVQGIFGSLVRIQL
jgi:protoporphyrinogen oxidase